MGSETANPEKVKKYGADIPMTDDYEDWDWKQIEAAIVGGADMGNIQKDKNKAEFSVPQTLWTAADSFFNLATEINNALTTFNYNVNALVGDGGPWKGDAAKVASDNFKYFSDAVTTQLDSINGKGDPSKAIYNHLYDSGNYLNWAINEITAIDEWYAGQAASLGATKHKTDDGTELIHVSDIKGLPEMITSSMQPVIKTLASKYKQSHDDTVIPPYSPPMLPPPKQNTPEIKIPPPPKQPKLDIPPPNGGAPQPPPFGGTGPDLKGLDGPGLGGPPANALTAGDIPPFNGGDLGNPDPFNSNTTPTDFGGLTAPNLGALPNAGGITGFPGGTGLNTLPNGLTAGGLPGAGGLGGFHLSAPGRLRSTGLPSSLVGPGGRLAGGKLGGGGFDEFGRPIGAGKLGGKLGGGFDEFGRPIGGGAGSGKGLSGFDEFGRPLSGKGLTSGNAFDEFGNPIGGKGANALAAEKGLGLRPNSAGALAEEEALAARGGPMGGMPMGGMGGGMGGARAGQDQDRERTTWLEEDEDVWGANQEAAPRVLGKQP